MQKPEDTMVVFPSLIKLVSRVSRFHSAKSPQTSTADLGALAEAVGALSLTSSVQQSEPAKPVVKSGLLVVLDMNGVLMFRVTPREKPPGSISPPDFVANRSKYWIRPYFDEFIEYLFVRHTVGLWSSMMKINVYMSAANLFGSEVLHPQYTFRNEPWYEDGTNRLNYKSQEVPKSSAARQGSSSTLYVDSRGSRGSSRSSRSSRSQGENRQQSTFRLTRGTPNSSSKSSDSRNSAQRRNAPNSRSSGKNAVGGHKEIRHPFHASLNQQRMFFIYSREACDHDHEGIRNLGLPRHATVKNLDTLWSVQNTYGPESTIVIDDSAYKIRLQANNQLHISEFDLAADSAQLQGDDSLIWSSLYLEHVSNGGVAIGDVREKVKHISYVEFLKQGKAWLLETHGSDADIGELVGWARSRPEFEAKFKNVEGNTIGSSPPAPEPAMAGAQV
eukprot:CAMPEP_0184695492 /NCGR_PEP_ID=MMETSP0313-20130426/3098_1 /TAXON_ID=2792 /ORGANISM="Porphyridium aerugineum, Strain SAG 1380-2" /LENGTH=444 /DNA_ID=CAMNT_0027153955 /DNA_START=316 /DNA_END=1650 /DNA_ORIENTATION=-